MVKKARDEASPEDALDARIERVQLTAFRPQERNANKHTERGDAALEASLQQDGWIGAITVAADGEAFVGSKRHEKAIQVGMEDALVVDSDGTKPIVIRRTDIPSAKDPRAVRLGIADNRTAQLGLDWDESLLFAINTEDPDLLTDFFTTKELDVMFEGFGDTPPEEGEGGDEFDTTPNLEGPTRAHRGDIWKLGPHTLMCGDALNPKDVERLMHDRVASLMLTDPPYNIGKEYKDDESHDALSVEDYYEWTRRWFELWKPHAQRKLITPGTVNLQMWMRLFTHKHIAPWIKDNATTAGRTAAFTVWEPILFYSDEGVKWKRDRPSDFFRYTIMEQRFPTGESMSEMHPCPKPLALWIDLIEAYTEPNEIVVDQFAGTGTTMVGCHRARRIAIMMEQSPAYCDVILSRALAEGIGPVERVGGSPPNVRDEIPEPELSLP